jgi:hypothetical protein
MLTFPYNQNENPPAPYIEVVISPSKKTDARTLRKAKIDSGASLTVIPDNLVSQWNLQIRRKIRVRGYDGYASERYTYLVDILIGSQHFEMIEVTCSRRVNILLGRDVLNKLRILHDGPRQVVEIHDV